MTHALSCLQTLKLANSQDWTGQSKKNTRGNSSEDITELAALLSKIKVLFER